MISSLRCVHKPIITTQFLFLILFGFRNFDQYLAVHGRTPVDDENKMNGRYFDIGPFAKTSFITYYRI